MIANTGPSPSPTPEKPILKTHNAVLTASAAHSKRLYRKCSGTRLAPQSNFVCGSTSDRDLAFTRWDEKAGLRRDAIRSQLFDVLEAQRKGDRRCRRLALCGPWERRFSKGSSRLVWIWEIVRVLTAF